MPTYAKTTDVTADRSRTEIERTLERFGADGFMYGRNTTRAMIGFELHGRQVRIEVPLPAPDADEFKYTPGRRQVRTPAARTEAYGQAVRQRWRVLALVVKAKLEAVEAEITTFEEEFLAFMVLPDGRTAAEHVMPAIDEAYRTGRVPPLLPMLSSAMALPAPTDEEVIDA